MSRRGVQGGEEGRSSRGRPRWQPAAVPTLPASWPGMGGAALQPGSATAPPARRTLRRCALRDAERWPARGDIERERKRKRKGCAGGGGGGGGGVGSGGSVGARCGSAGARRRCDSFFLAGRIQNENLKLSYIFGGLASSEKPNSTERTRGEANGNQEGAGEAAFIRIHFG